MNLKEHIDWLQYFVALRSEIEPTDPHADFPWMKAYAQGWESPLPEVVSAVIEAADLSSAAVARLVGLSDGKQVRNWKAGINKIQYATWRYLLLRLGVITLKEEPCP